MKYALVKPLFLAMSIAAAAATAPALAQEDKGITPGVTEQIMMAERLVSLGKARNDPMLLIAALRLRNNLSQDAMPPVEKFSSKEEILEAVNGMVEGRDDLKELIKDEASSSSRGYCYPSWGRQICTY